jgi:uncharacterized protein (TIGR04255 family)
MSEAAPATKEYIRPPIIEVVLELTYGTPLDRQGIERLAGVFDSSFARQDEADISVKIEGGQVTPTISTPAGIQLIHPFPHRTILLRQRTITYSRTAPYPGWEAFFLEAVDAFRKSRKRVGYRPVTRVGLRYVNRIDIPYGAENQPPDVRDYLNFGPATITILGMATPTNYLTQCEFFPSDGWAKVIVRSGTTPPALIRHTSMLLDIDVFVDKDLPQQEEELEALMHRLRDLKNRVFADCITAQAEALFGLKA